MTDETKKLFDAPYKVYETRNGYNVICTNKVLPQLCWTTDKKDANRISHLPELYDACVEAVYHRCFDCMGGFRHDIGLTSEDLLNDGCPKKSNNCFFLKTLDLLRKVRDGK